MRSYILTNSQWNQLHQNDQAQVNTSTFLPLNRQEENYNLEIRDRNMNELQNRETRRHLLEMIPEFPSNLREEQSPVDRDSEMTLQMRDFLCLPNSEEHLDPENISENQQTPEESPQIFGNIPFVKNEPQIFQEPDNIKKDNQPFDKRENFLKKIPKNALEEPYSGASSSNKSKD